jgi:hypothetical protein
MALPRNPFRAQIGCLMDDVLGGPGFKFVVKPLCEARKGIVALAPDHGEAERVLLAPEIGIGGASRLLPSHTTVRTGPYTAVRRIKRTPVPAGGVTAGVWKRVSPRTLRSLHHRAVGLHPSVLASRAGT